MSRGGGRGGKGEGITVRKRGEWKHGACQGAGDCFLRQAHEGDDSFKWVTTCKACVGCRSDIKTLKTRYNGSLSNDEIVCTKKGYPGQRCSDIANISM